MGLLPTTLDEKGVVPVVEAARVSVPQPGRIGDRSKVDSTTVASGPRGVD
jgi:hypothetical protein